MTRKKLWASLLVFIVVLLSVPSVATTTGRLQIYVKQKSDNANFPDPLTVRMGAVSSCPSGCNVNCLDPVCSPQREKTYSPSPGYAEWPQYDPGKTYGFFIKDLPPTWEIRSKDNGCLPYRAPNTGGVASCTVSISRVNGRTGTAPDWATAARNALSAYATLAKQEINNNDIENNARYLDYYLLTGDQQFLNRMETLANNEWDESFNGGGCFNTEQLGKSEQMGTHFSAPQGSLLIATNGGQKYLDRVKLSANYIVNKWLGVNARGHTHFKSYWNTCTKSYSLDPNNPGNNQHFDNDIPNTGVLAKLAILPLFFQENQSHLDKMKDWAHSWAEDMLRTDSGKPFGIMPAEIKFSDDDLNGYPDLKGYQSCALAGSDTWAKMSGNISWACDWDYRRFVVVTDYLHSQLFAMYRLNADPKIMEAQKAELDYYFNGPATVNGVPPNQMDENGQWIDQSGFSIPPVDWYIGYRHLSGDTSLDAVVKNGFLKTMEEMLQSSGNNARGSILRGTKRWNTASSAASVDAAGYLDWLLTGDKKWLELAFNQYASTLVNNNNHLFLYAYNGAIERGYANGFMPLMAISWENVDTNYAALVLSHSRNQLKLLTYNFNNQPQNAKITLWELEPGTYRFKRGIDEDQDNQMDTVIEEKTFTVTAPRQKIDLALPANALQAVEIAVETAAPEIKLVSPNGNEQWQDQNNYEIFWQATPTVDKISLVLYRDRQLIGVIARDVPAAAGRISWTPGPDLLEGSNYRVGVYQYPYRENQPVDFSNGPFVIKK